jgi:hypothetical protein
MDAIAAPAVANKALILDLVEWLAAAPRPYADVMDAWRTSCPRLTIWEDALDLGFVARRQHGPTAMVELTAAGHDFLCAERPAAR